MTETTTTEDLRAHELIILRRLREHPLTEFELTAEIAEHTAYSAEVAADRIGEWLDQLREQGLLWYGKLFNDSEQFIAAAALTRRGRELVG